MRPGKAWWNLWPLARLGMSVVCVVRFLVKSLHSSLNCPSPTKVKRLFFTLSVFIWIFLFAVYEPQESKRFGPQQQFSCEFLQVLQDMRNITAVSHRGIAEVLRSWLGLLWPAWKVMMKRLGVPALAKTPTTFQSFRNLIFFQVRLDEGVPCHGGAQARHGIGHWQWVRAAPQPCTMASQAFSTCLSQHEVFSGDLSCLFLHSLLFFPFLEENHHNFCRRSHFRMISGKPRPMRRVSPSSSAAVAFGRPSSSTWPSLHRGEKDEMRRWKLRDVDVTVINVIRM